MAHSTIDQNLLAKAQLLEAIQKIGLANTPQDLLEAFKDTAAIKDSTRSSIILFEANANLSVKRACVEAVIGESLDDVSPVGTIYTPDMIPLFWEADPAEPLVIENVQTNTRLNEQSRNILERLGVQALVALGLIATEAHIGWLLIENQSPRIYSAGDISLLQVSTQHLAVAVQNHRLMAHTQQRARQIQTGAEISRITSSILDQGELIHKAVNLIKEGFEFYYVGVFLIDPAEEWAVLQAGSGEEGRLQMGAKHRLALNDHSMIGWCITRKQARIALDVGEDAAHFDNPHLPLTRSEMALPLISRDQIIGAVTVQSAKSAAFSDDDIATLQIMADQLANAIINSQLYQESQHSARELENLYQMSRQLATAETVSQAAEIAVQKAPKGRFERILVGLRDEPDNPENTWVEMIAVWDKAGQKNNFLGNRFSAEQIPVMAAVSKEELIIVADFGNHPSIGKKTKDVFSKLGVKSAIILPVKAGQKLLGWFLSETITAPIPFTQDDAAPLLALVDQLGSTIDRIQKTESLIDAGQQYLTMVDNIPGAVYRAKFGDTHALTYVSDDLSDLTGYPIERFYDDGDLSIAALIHPQDSDKVEKAIHRQLQRKQPYEVQYRIFDKNDQIKHILERGMGVFDDHDQLLHVDGILFDVTERVVLEQTAGRRAAQFEAAAQVGQKASAILDVDRLLVETVNLISDTFDFYYAGLFLLDKNEEWAMFSAGSGSAGKKLLEAGHRLKKDENSMVGWAAYHGKPRVTFDVGQEEHRYDNPHLPLTRSEVALPLTSRGKVIGALDVQSIEENAFTKEDIETLQLMANQLANVIENARFFKTTQRNLYRANLLYHTTRTLLEARTEEELFKVFIETVSQSDIDTISISLYGGSLEDRYFEIKEVWDSHDNVVNPVGTKLGVNSSALSRLFYQNETILIEDTKTDPRLTGPSGQKVAKAGVHSIIGLPIILQEEAQGVVVISSKNPDKAFTREEVRFFENMVQQLSITWQNLILLRASEKRFRRERIIRQLTGKIHAAVGVENILQTTVAELGKALNAPGGIARLGDDPEMKERAG